MTAWKLGFHASTENSREESCHGVFIKIKMVTGNPFWFWGLTFSRGSPRWGRGRSLRVSHDPVSDAENHLFPLFYCHQLSDGKGQVWGTLIAILEVGFQNLSTH